MSSSARTATILVTDLVGSTAIRVRLGEEQADTLRRVHDDDYLEGEQALARAYDAARNRLLERVHDRILETLQAMPNPSAEPARAEAGAT